MTKTRTVAMYLAARAGDSKVIIDGFDVTNMTRGVEISSYVGRPTEITLYLIGNVELIADAKVDLDVQQNPKGEQP